MNISISNLILLPKLKKQVGNGEDTVSRRENMLDNGFLVSVKVSEREMLFFTSILEN